MGGQRHITAVGSAGVHGALPVVALVAGLVAAFVAVPAAAAPIASAAPGDRVWARSIASSSLAENFVDVARGRQHTVYAAARRG